MITLEEKQDIEKTIDILDLTLKNLELNHQDESYAFYYIENCRDELIEELKESSK